MSFCHARLVRKKSAVHIYSYGAVPRGRASARGVVRVSVSSLFTEAELVELNAAPLFAGSRHPTWMAAIRDQRGRIGYLMDNAVDRIRCEPGGSVWLASVKKRLIHLGNLEDTASALAELRTYGAFLSAGVGITPIPRSNDKTPDFALDFGNEPVILEVYSKHQDDKEARLNAALHSKDEHSGIERKTTHVTGARLDFSTTVLHPGGAPDPNKAGDSTQANLVSRLCRAKGDETQLPNDQPSLLWLDLANFGPWPEAITLDQADPLLTGNYGFTSGAFWHAFYGCKGAPLLEPLWPTRTQMKVAMGHDGRFRLTGVKKSKLAAVIIRVSEECAIFENPWAAHRLSNQARRALVDLPDVHLQRSVLDWLPGDVEKSLELAEGQLAAILRGDRYRNDAET